MTKRTYLEKHVEELTERVGVLEKILSKILADDTIVKKLRIKSPYPTPEKYSFAEVDSGEPDEYYDEVWQVISESGKVSTSYIQRKFSLGYNRSAKIMEQLEKEGVIGPADGVQPRTVLKKYSK